MSAYGIFSEPNPVMPANAAPAAQDAPPRHREPPPKSAEPPKPAPPSHHKLDLKA